MTPSPVSTRKYSWKPETCLTIGMNPLSTNPISSSIVRPGASWYWRMARYARPAAGVPAIGLASCAAAGTRLLASNAARPPLPRRSTALRRESAADPDEVQSNRLNAVQCHDPPLQGARTNRPIPPPVYERRQQPHERRLYFPQTPVAQKSAVAFETGLDQSGTGHEALPLSRSRQLPEINRESGDHQDERIGSAPDHLIDTPQDIPIVPPQ